MKLLLGNKPIQSYYVYYKHLGKGQTRASKKKKKCIKGKVSTSADA